MLLKGIEVIITFFPAEQYFNTNLREIFERKNKKNSRLNLNKNGAAIARRPGRHGGKGERPARQYCKRFIRSLVSFDENLLLKDEKRRHFRRRVFICVCVSDTNTRNEKRKE